MCVSVWGKVELTMNDNLEVYLGDPAEIPCHYSFTGVNEEPSFVIIQWFVVSKLTVSVWNWLFQKQSRFLLHL